MKIKPGLFLIFSFSLFLIISCGGAVTNEEDKSTTLPVSPGTSTTETEILDNSRLLFGTAASGSPIAGTVTATGIYGKSLTKPIALNGDFTLDPGGLTPPFLLKAEGRVHGKSLTLFSVCTESGRINVTPLTNLILFSIIGRNSNNIFKEWEFLHTNATAESISAAETRLRQQIKPLLAVYGILENSVNLMSSEFETDNSGIDGLLDIIEIAFKGSIATIKNRVTGSTISNDIRGETAEELFEKNETIKTRHELKNRIPVKVLKRMLETIYLPVKAHTNDPSDIQGIAPDYFDNGDNKNNFLKRLPLKKYNSSSGTNIYAAIINPMDISEYDTEKYEKGVWINVSIIEKGIAEDKLNSVVFDGKKWLLYGNRRWVEADIRANSLTEVDSSVKSKFYTGLNIRLKDGNNYAHRQGIKSAIITGPGLPETGLVLALNYPDFHFKFARKAPTMDKGLHRYSLNDDNVIKEIYENSIYSVNLYTELPENVSLGNTSVHTFTKTVPGRPLLNSLLDSSLFFDIEIPAYHTVSSLDYKKPMTVIWSSVSGPSNIVTSAWIILYNSDSRFQQYTASKIDNANKTVQIDMSGFTGKAISHAELWLKGYGKFGSTFETKWIFSENGLAHPLKPPPATGKKTFSDPRPTWTWESGGPGAGLYRYRLDSNDFSTGTFTVTTENSYTPSYDLTDGSHTLFIQELDKAGNWSAAGSLDIIINTTTATFEHSATIGSCNNCHPKEGDHRSTSTTCGDCHLTDSWLSPKKVDHTAVTGGCSGCHSKLDTHIQTNDICELCHSIISWLNPNVDHTAVTGGCSDCHQKPGNHRQTSSICESCHSVISWLDANLS